MSSIPDRSDIDEVQDALVTPSPVAESPKFSGGGASEVNKSSKALLQQSVARKNRILRRLSRHSMSRSVSSFSLNPGLGSTINIREATRELRKMQTKLSKKLHRALRAGNMRNADILSNKLRRVTSDLCCLQSKDLDFSLSAFAGSTEMKLLTHIFDSDRMQS